MSDLFNRLLSKLSRLGLSDVTIATDLSDLGKKSSSEAATDISAYFVKYLTAYTTNIITETYTEAMTSGKPYSPQVSLVQRIMYMLTS